MGCESIKRRGVNVLRASGRPAQYSDQMCEAFTRLLEEGGRLFALNLTGVHHMDSAAIGGLLKRYKSIREHQGSLVLVLGQDWILRGSEGCGDLVLRAYVFADHLLFDEDCVGSEFSFADHSAREGV